MEVVKRAERKVREEGGGCDGGSVVVGERRGQADGERKVKARSKKRRVEIVERRSKGANGSDGRASLKLVGQTCRDEGDG